MPIPAFIPNHTAARPSPTQASDKASQVPTHQKQDIPTQAHPHPPHPAPPPPLQTPTAPHPAARRAVSADPPPPAPRGTTPGRPTSRGPCRAGSADAQAPPPPSHGHSLRCGLARLAFTSCFSEHLAHTVPYKVTKVLKENPLGNQRGPRKSRDIGRALGYAPSITPRTCHSLPLPPPPPPPPPSSSARTGVVQVLLAQEEDAAYQGRVR
jgi:hypothetical protein